GDSNLATALLTAIELFDAGGAGQHLALRAILRERDAKRDVLAARRDLEHETVAEHGMADAIPDLEGRFDPHGGAPISPPARSRAARIRGVRAHPKASVPSPAFPASGRCA